MVFSPSHVWQSFLCRSVKLLMDCQDRARCIDKKLHQVYNPWIASSCHTMHLQYKPCPVPLDIHPEWNKDVKYMPYYCWPHVFAYDTVMRVRNQEFSSLLPCEWLAVQPVRDVWQMHWRHPLPDRLSRNDIKCFDKLKRRSLLAWQQP